MPKSVDWSAVEEFLFEAATKQLASVSTDEPFYGAIFDVEPFDGCSVSLLLNTESHLTAEWKQPIGKTDLHRRFMPSCFEPRFPLTRKNKAFPATEIEELTEADIDEDDTDEDGLWATTGTLLETCCRVAQRLESTAFAKLSRTPDFTIAVTPDPSEPGDFSVARYAKFKKRAAKAAGTKVQSGKSKPTPSNKSKSAAPKGKSRFEMKKKG